MKRSSISALPIALVCLFQVIANGDNCALTIAAASDLAPLRQALIDEFDRAHPCKLTFTFSSSGQLASQIEQGAPYDIYLSASEEYVKKLSSAGLIERDSVTVFARGRLGLWAPAKAGGVSIHSLGDAGFKKIAIANPAHAPYGSAAKQALVASGVWEGLQPRLVLGENVRQALQFAETGNVDAVITAWSLVKNKPGASALDVGLHKEIRQTLGILAASANKANARLFSKWLASGKGRTLLGAAGFY